MSQPSRSVYTASQRTVPDRLMALPPDQTLLTWIRETTPDVPSFIL